MECRQLFKIITLLISSYSSVLLACPFCAMDIEQFAQIAKLNSYSTEDCAAAKALFTKVGGHLLHLMGTAKNSKIEPVNDCGMGRDEKEPFYSCWVTPVTHEFSREKPSSIPVGIAVQLYLNPERKTSCWNYCEICALYNKVNAQYSDKIRQWFGKLIISAFYSYQVLIFAYQFENPNALPPEHFGLSQATGDALAHEAAHPEEDPYERWLLDTTI